MKAVRWSCFDGGPAMVVVNAETEVSRWDCCARRAYNYIQLDLERYRGRDCNLRVADDKFS